MHRIDGPGATPSNLFTEGDPVGGIEATTVTDEWLNDMQENVMAVLSAAGVVATKGRAEDLRDAIVNLTPGRLLNVRVFDSTVASYTPTAGTRSVHVMLQAGGGGGGGAPAPGGSGMSMGAAGGAGSYAEIYLTSGFSGVAITLPPGGIGGTGGIGATAATASFGGLLSCPGGIGGGVAGPSASGFIVASAPTTGPTGGTIKNYRGVGSDFSISLGASNGQVGKAGTSAFGPGGPSSGVPTTPGSASPSPGAGGGGTALLTGAAASTGGQGGGARCVIFEYR